MMKACQITKKPGNKLPRWFLRSIVVTSPKTSSPSMFVKEFSSVHQTKASKDDGFNEPFHDAIKPVLVIAQCFALLPVTGIKSKFPSDLNFSWCSLRIWYSVFIASSMLFMTLLTLFKLVIDKLEFGKIVSLMFYSSNCLSVIFFLRIARRWPELMKYWDTVEERLPKTEQMCGKKSLKKRIRKLVILVTALALLEHILSIISGIYKAHNCVGIRSSVERYFKQSFPQLFFVTEYADLKAALAQILNFFCTFSWNFMDLFIISMSIGLATRFKQINVRVKMVKGLIMPESFWAEQRLHYQNLVDLIRAVDDSIGEIVLLSYSNNLYFVCVQLLNSLKPMDTYVHVIYFWYSLIFLIARTFGVSLYSSKINDESRKPIGILRCVPSNGCNMEVHRFLEIVTHDWIALSGKKFFYLTRQLILKIAGTIITYELVLVQFNDSEQVLADDPNPCT